ncbi:MAG: hypothetical protein ACE5IR_16025 [bacterium]
MMTIVCASQETRKFLWALFLFCATSLWAIPKPPLNENQTFAPIYAFEFLTFKSANPEKTYLEVFCQIPTDHLQFIKCKDGFFASFRLTISLSEGTGRNVVEESYVDSVKVKTFWDIDRVRDPKLIRYAFLVPPGIFEAKMSLKDLETFRQMTFSKTLEIPDYSIKNLTMSDLQIAASITKTQEQNGLVKNHRKILPNIPRIVGSELDMLYVYNEVYNLDISDETESKGFTASYTVIDEKGQRVKTLEVTHQKPNISSFLTASISVEELTSGQYKLILDVWDLDNNSVIRKSTNFLVLRPGLDAKLYTDILAKAFGERVRF